nr:histidine kinase dimerization/phosphoacceptor domain -containing protein [uncultured Gellertiella sp.]
MSVSGSKGWRERLGGRSLALAMGMVFFLAVMGLTALMIWQNYRAASSSAEARAVASAHVVAANMQWMIEASDQALRRMDSVFATTPIQSSQSAISDIAQAVGALPAGFQYSVYDDTGRLRLSSVPNAPVVNVADRDYFRAVREADQTVVSRQLEERVSKEQVFIVARRISQAGKFGGVATIAIPVGRLADFWNSLGLGALSSIGVIGSDGWLVARYPAVVKSISLGQTPIFQPPLKWQQSGFYHSEKSPVDGLSRVVGFWRVDKWPLIAVTGIENGEMLDLFWSALKSEVALGLPMVTLLLLEGLAIVALLRAYMGRNRALEHALERNNFLFREIHHRVKNNLQAVSALIRLQPVPDQVRREMVHRISAMIAVHEQIYQSDQFDRVEVAPYLARVIAEIAKAYNRDVVITSKFDSLMVDRDQALPIGLIVNEVVSNAFKYAFADRQGGKLNVELAGDGERACLTISDDGPGFDADVAAKGMGSKLIAGFVAQLGGTCGFENRQGTVFTMSFPLY